MIVIEHVVTIAHMSMCLAHMGLLRCHKFNQTTNSIGNMYRMKLQMKRCIDRGTEYNPIVSGRWTNKQIWSPDKQ